MRDFLCTLSCQQRALQSPQTGPLVFDTGVAHSQFPQGSSTYPRIKSYIFTSAGRWIWSGLGWAGGSERRISRRRRKRWSATRKGLLISPGPKKSMLSCIGRSPSQSWRKRSHQVKHEISVVWWLYLRHLRWQYPLRNQERRSCKATLSRKKFSWLQTRLRRVNKGTRRDDRHQSEHNINQHWVGAQNT